MKVPAQLVPVMRGMLKISIPMTYIFMVVGTFMVVAFATKLEWHSALFCLLFVVFAVLHRIYCIRMLVSLERTGTTYKWKLKND